MMDPTQGTVNSARIYRVSSNTVETLFTDILLSGKLSLQPPSQSPFDLTLPVSAHSRNRTLPPTLITIQFSPLS